MGENDKIVTRYMGDRDFQAIGNLSQRLERPSKTQEAEHATSLSEHRHCTQNHSMSVIARHLFDRSVLHDNLFLADRYKWSMSVTAINVTNKVAGTTFSRPSAVGGGNSRLLTGSAFGGHWPFKNRSILGNTISGNSTQDICAAPSIVIRRALGSSRSHSRPPPYGAFRSFLPWIVRTGTVSFATDSLGRSSALSDASSGSKCGQR